ncbi:MAG: hypothetical protein M1833_002922 [Piccolia ochrophora]|nr:MAG: hypothetical protein M1833_002922 [Piccolia ochrophora]
MSNYPPTPSFGQNYGFAPHPNMTPSYPYQGNYNPYFQGPPTGANGHVNHQSTMAAAAARQTAHAFNQNGNLPGLNVQHAPHFQSPATPTLAQYPQASLPPPPFPFPHMPLTPMGHNIPAPSPYGDVKVLNPTSQQQTLPALPPQPPLHLNAATAEQAMRSGAHPPDREEGELTDSDVKEILIPPQTDGAGDSRGFTRMSHWKQKRGAITAAPAKVIAVVDLSHFGVTDRKHQDATRDASQPVLPPATKRRPSPKQWRVPENRGNHPDSPTAPETHQVRARSESVEDDYEPRYGVESLLATPHSVLPQRPVLDSSQQPSNELSPLNVDDLRGSGHEIARISPQQTLQQYASILGKPLSETRTLAKNAVLNLLPYQIRFEDYVAEGINEEFLKGIFDELGIKISPARNSQPVAGPEGIGAEQAVEKASFSIPSTQAERDEEPQLTRQSPPIRESEDGAGQLSVLANTGATEDLPTANTLTPLAGRRDRPDVATPSDVPTRGTTAKSFGSKSLRQAPAKSLTGAEPIARKDLIAQKLAARSGKMVPAAAHPPPPTVPKPPSTSTESFSRLTATAVGASTVPSAEPSHSKEIPENRNLSLQEKPAPARTVHSVDVDTNHVIRQRTEALNRSGVKKSDAVLPTVQKKLAGSRESSIDPALSSTPLDVPQEHEASRAHQPREQQQLSSIPGLFMTSPPPSQQAKPLPEIVQESAPESSQGVRRKRPVAADFVTEIPANNVVRQPFGHSNINRPLVIDVSEDDTADGADDSDFEMGDASSYEQAVQQQIETPSNQRTVVRDMPPLPDLPSNTKAYLKSGGSTPGSALATPRPGTVDGKDKAATQKHLKRKEEEIQLMQKKIAELEQKKAKHIGSRAQSPGSLGSLTPAKTAISGSAAKVAATADIDRLIQDTSRQVEEDKLELAEAKAAESNRIRDTVESAVVELAEAKQHAANEAEAENMQRRRMELEQSLSQADAQMESDRLWLEQMQKERSQREAAVREVLQKKLKLEEELQRLRSGFPRPVSEVQASERGSRAFEEKGTDDNPEAAVAVATHASPNRFAPEHMSRSPALTIDGDDPDVPQSRGSETPVLAEKVTLLKSVEISAKEDLPKSISEGPVEIGQRDIDTEAEVPQGRREALLSPGDQSPFRAVEPNTPGVDGSLHGKTTPSDLDMDDIYASDNAQPMAIDDDSGVETHVPEVTGLNQISGDDESMEEEGEILTDSRSSSRSGSYEPPGARSPPLNIPLDSPPFSPAPAIDSAHASPNPVRSSPRSSFESRAVDITSGRVEVANAETKISPILGNVSTIGTEFKAPAKRNGNDESVNASTNLGDYFTPYSSPLKSLRSFRYRPSFLSEVSGGYRSLTYSHNIDPNKELCRYEASGGVCNDDSCEFQHFRDMKISDDMILVQIGNVKINGSLEEKKSFTSGLKQTLHDLRTRKVKDFDVVASVISSYRNQFLQDHPKIF